MPSPERAHGVVDEYVDAYRRNDRDAALALFRPDAVWHDPVGAPPHVGHKGIGAFWDEAHSMADSITLVPSNVIVCGDEAVMVFEIHVAIGDGGMVMDAVEVFSLDADGRIGMLKAYWDMARARPRT